MRGAGKHRYNRAEKSDMWSDADCIIEEGKNIFVSKFRNCMMHYNLNRDNKFRISENNFVNVT